MSIVLVVVYVLLEFLIKDLSSRGLAINFHLVEKVHDLFGRVEAESFLLLEVRVEETNVDSIIVVLDGNVGNLRNDLLSRILSLSIHGA